MSTCKHVLAAVLSAALLASCGTTNTNAPEVIPSTAAPSVSTQTASKRAVQLHSDHPTFTTVAELFNSAENVFEGTVTSHVTIPGDDAGPDEAGDQIPTPPTTEYTVTMTEVFRGNLTAGSTVVVVELGGDDGETLYVTDDGTVLADGVTSVFFAGSVISGRLAAVAGGSAVGTKNPDGTYTLPGEVAGVEENLVVTQAQLVTTQTPATLEPTSGDRQTAQAGQPFPVALACRVLDETGKPVAATPVTYEVLSGSASFSGNATAQTTTGSDGVATAPQLLAGQTAGPVVVRATAGKAVVEFVENVTPSGFGKADLKVAVAAPATAKAGQIVTVNVEVTNGGTAPVTKATTVVVVPRGLTITNGGTGTTKGRLVLWRANSIAAGGTVTYTLRVKVDARCQPRVTVAAATGSLTPESSYRNNVARAVIQIRK